MKIVVSLTMALLLTTILISNTLALETGDMIPMTETPMLNVDGKMVMIDEVRGKKGTLIIFSCNHCPYAKAWESRIAEIGNEYMEKGFGVIVINPNDPVQQPEDSFEEMKARSTKLGFKFPYVVDAKSTVASYYKATKTPEAYLFDKGGRLVYQGAIDDNSEHADQVKYPFLRNALDATLTGGLVEVTRTAALGCSIKFYPAD